MLLTEEKLHAELKLNHNSSTLLQMILWHVVIVWLIAKDVQENWLLELLQLENVKNVRMDLILNLLLRWKQHVLHKERVRQVNIFSLNILNIGPVLIMRRN